MTTFNDLAVVQLREHINASGLPAGFTNVKGGAEPALKSQLEFYDDKEMLPDTRYLVYMDGSQSSPYPSLIDERSMSIIVTGKETQANNEAQILKGLAQSIKNYLVENFRSETNCISSITITSGVTGPYKSDTRFNYRIDMLVRFGV